jgi:hypothetical protein
VLVLYRNLVILTIPHTLYDVTSYTNTTQTNVVSIDISTGQLYYQGPADTSGSFATTGSNTFNGNQTISGSLNVSGSISTNYVYVDTYFSQSYYLIDNPACVYRFSNTTGQTVSVNIPNASTCPGRIYYISRPAESDADVIILNSASNIENGDGGSNTSITLASNEKYQWISDGTSWILISTNKLK